MPPPIFFKPCSMLLTTIFCHSEYMFSYPIELKREHTYWTMYHRIPPFIVALKKELKTTHTTLLFSYVEY